MPRKSFARLALLAPPAAYVAFIAACSPSTKESAPAAFADIPAEPPAPGDRDEGFGLDRSREGVVQTQKARSADGGVAAWCTTPSPEQVRTTTDLSPTTTLRVYAGGCIPSEGYAAACDDAGRALYTPTCDSADTGKRLELAVSGKAIVTVRADSVELLQGPLPDGTWPIGSSQRAILASTDARVGSGASAEKTTRVVAVASKDDWHEPAEDFAEVATNPKNGTFTFWRKAMCVETLGCVIARWEASKAGLHITTAERDRYAEARKRLAAEAVTQRGAGSACPTDVILTAARVFALARISGEAEGKALKEFDGLVAGLDTKSCPMTPTGHPKPVRALRSDLAAGVRKLLASH